MVDLRRFCGPVRDQGNLQSCVGQATGGAMEFLRNVRTLAVAPETDLLLSRMLPWFEARLREGTQLQNVGCYPRDALKALADMGECREDAWPYDAANAYTPPSDAAVQDAGSRKVTVYAALAGLADVRAALAAKYPVLLIFNMYADSLSNDGHLGPPQPRTLPIGGHCVLVVGYDDAKQELLFQNSWGERWGDAGFGYLPYAYLTTGDAYDLWTVRDEQDPGQAVAVEAFIARVEQQLEDAQAQEARGEQELEQAEVVSKHADEILHGNA